MSLQREAGNRAVTELLRRGQARLTLGPSDDPHEAEADRFAAYVSQLVGHSGVRHADDPGTRTEVAPPQIMRWAPSQGPAGELNEEIDTAITSARGNGRPLERGLRTEMESAFGGTDFSGVRLHAGPGPAQLNRQLSAEAFTVGSDIFFRGSIPDRSSQGNLLLAHELTHTIQQGAAGPAVQRWPWSKSKKKDKNQGGPPSLDPMVAQQVATAIANHKAMLDAEKARDWGDEEEALRILEDFWNRESVEVTVNGTTQSVKLSDFKPLMFTPSERRVVKNRKWRLAQAVKGMWDTAVRKGEVKVPPSVKEDDPSKTVGMVSDYTKQIGDPITELAGAGAKGTSKIELLEQGSKAVKKAGSAPKKTVGQDLMSSSSDDSAYKDTGEWASGIISVIGETVDLVSSVTQTIKLALDKKATKADVASQIGDNLAKAAITADRILEVIQHAEGAELTTQVFHWVPGLAIFSNGFAAMSSAVSLVQRAYRVYKIDQGRTKTTEKEAEDLALAMERVWVRAVQQVEQDAFTTAKSLTNAGLAIAEVATAGGFGIPRLAQAIMSGATYVHKFGHAVADSVRAAKTKDARKNYFGAKLSGSAEKLVRHDPWEAAHAIVSRAAEGDKTAQGLLEAYNVKLSTLEAPSEKREIPEKEIGGERTMTYDSDSVDEYSNAVEILAEALKVGDEPQTLWDQIKSTVDKAVKMPGEFRDRYRQAKRIRDVRNEQNYKGKSDRGFWWAFKYSGLDDKLKKVSEKTQLAINEAFRGDTNPTSKSKGSPFKVDSEKVRDDLVARIQPEAILRAKEKERKDATRPVKEVVRLDFMPAWNNAMNLSIGALASIVERGKKASGLSNEDWQLTVSVYALRLQEMANAPTPTTV